MSGSKIVWKNINNIVFTGLSILKDTNSQSVTEFLDWYDKIDQKTVTVADPTNQIFKNWVIKGIPQMKKIDMLMNKEVKKLDNSITQIILSKNNLSDKIKLKKQYYEKIKIILQSVIELMGCRNDFGQWYIGFLKLFPQEPAVKNNIHFFELECLIDRTKLLKL